MTHGCSSLRATSELNTYIKHTANLFICIHIIKEKNPYSVSIEYKIGLERALCRINARVKTLPPGHARAIETTSYTQVNVVTVPIVCVHILLTRERQDPYCE